MKQGRGKKIELPSKMRPLKFLKVHQSSKTALEVIHKSNKKLITQTQNSKTDFTDILEWRVSFYMNLLN